MKANLMKHKPAATSPEKFKTEWEAQTYTLQPLYDYLRDVIGSIDQVKEADFSIPNHYALLAHRAGKKALAQEIQALLPKGCSE